MNVEEDEDNFPSPTRQFDRLLERFIQVKSSFSKLEYSLSAFLCFNLFYMES